MTVRPATPDDADIIALHRYPEDRDATERPIYADWVRGALRSGKYVGLLAVGVGKVTAGAGLVLMDWWPTRNDPNPVRARLVNVWTDPEFRRQGLARTLVTRLIAEAAARGIRTVSLSTSVMGRALYEDIGFRAYPHEMILTLDDVT